MEDKRYCIVRVRTENGKRTEDTPIHNTNRERARGLVVEFVQVEIERLLAKCHIGEFQSFNTEFSKCGNAQITYGKSHVSYLIRIEA